MGEKREKVRLSFKSVGSQDSKVNGANPPIILLHGFTSNKEGWENILHPIAEATGRKVYAYDARNHGDSGWSTKFDYEVMRKDLLLFMEGLNCDKAVLVGHSMGGKVAMFFALKWPDKVEKLIVEDISPKPISSEARQYTKKFLQLLHHALEKIPAEIKDLPEAQTFINQYLNDAISQEDIEGNSSQGLLPLTQYENGKFGWKFNLKAFDESLTKKFQSPTMLSGIFSGPTLLLWGTKSPFNVTDDRGCILEHFPQARFREIKGASHQIHRDYTDIFLQEVKHFINQAR